MPIASLREGEAIVVGDVLRVKERRGRFPLVSAALQDATGIVEAKWFGRRYLVGQVSPPAIGCSSPAA